MSVLIKDFRRIAWENRKTTIVFDSDIKFNNNVQLALSRLRDKLVELGADPYRRDLPHEAGSEKTGLDDYLKKQGKRSQIAFEKLPLVPLFHHHTITGAELAQQKFPPLKWAINGLIPIGLTILAGPPKVGKSWLILSIIMAISSHSKALGHYETEQMDCLYIALEDPPRRLQERIRKLTEGQQQINEHSHFATEWEKVEQGGLDALERKLERMPTCKIVFIDTLAKIRKPPTGKGSLYQEDYEEVGTLKPIADKHGVGVVVVHHLRKAASDDYLERVSGSTGLTGAADTIMVLVRDRSNADGVLHVTGRDVAEQSIALKFQNGRWSYLGDAMEVSISNVRAEILNVLQDAGRPLGPKEIGSMIGKRAESLAKTLSRMMQAGLIEWHVGGKYTPKEQRQRKFHKQEEDR